MLATKQRGSKQQETPGKLRWQRSKLRGSKLPESKRLRIKPRKTPRIKLKLIE
jgi:hypothetical protein